MQALAMHSNKRPVLLPSKRTSVSYQAQQCSDRHGECPCLAVGFAQFSHAALHMESFLC